MAVFASFTPLLQGEDSPAIPNALNAPIRFLSTSTSNDPADPIVSWSWTFGQPNVPNSSYENPVRSFKATGSPLVSLTVTSLLGAVDTFSRTIYIDSTADWNFGTMSVGQTETVNTRMAGPVIAFDKTWVFYAPDSVSTSGHKLIKVTNAYFIGGGGVPEATFSLPSGTYLDVTKSRMLGKADFLAFVADTDTIFFLNSAIGPVLTHQIPGFKLKALANMTAFAPFLTDVLWVLGLRDTDNAPFLFGFVRKGGLLELAHQIDYWADSKIYEPVELSVDSLFVVNFDPGAVESGDLQVGDDVAVVFPLAGAYMTPGESGPVQPGQVRDSGLWARYYPKKNLFTPITGSRGRLRGMFHEKHYVHPSFPDRVVRPYHWQIAAGDWITITKLLDSAFYEALAEYHVVSCLFYDYYYDQMQNLWVYGRDFYLDDYYVERLVGPNLHPAPSGAPFVACYNLVLREFVRFYWLQTWTDDRGTGEEV